MIVFTKFPHFWVWIFVKLHIGIGKVKWKQVDREVSGLHIE